MINLLCDEETFLSAEDMDLLSSIGAQVSEIVANVWLRLKLKEKEIARQALLESLVNAQEAERGRLARELHDGAGQTLTSLLVRMKTLEKEGLPDRKQTLENMQEIVSQTIEEIREISYRLRPVVLSEFGLPMALETLTQEIAKNGSLQISFLCKFEETRLPEEIEMALYRIAQEGLTNVLKHARAMHVSLELTRNKEAIQMCIVDDGVGFDPSRLPSTAYKQHLGLISMQERAEILGGTVNVHSVLKQGTSIQVAIPAAYTNGTQRMTEQLIRILLVDDHKMFRDGLKVLLESEDNIRVIGEADTGEQAIRLGLELQPDIIVMDIGLPDMNGIEAIQAIRGKPQKPDHCTIHVQPQRSRQAIDRGGVRRLCAKIYSAYKPPTGDLCGSGRQAIP